MKANKAGSSVPAWLPLETKSVCHRDVEKSSSSKQLFSERMLARRDLAELFHLISTKFFVEIYM